jgi:hypothetical protein
VLENNEPVKTLIKEASLLYSEFSEILGHFKALIEQETTNRPALNRDQEAFVTQLLEKQKDFAVETETTYQGPLFSTKLEEKYLCLVVPHIKSEDYLISMMDHLLKMGLPDYNSVIEKIEYRLINIVRSARRRPSTLENPLALSQQVNKGPAKALEMMQKLSAMESVAPVSLVDSLIVEIEAGIDANLIQRDQLDALLN